MAEGLYTNRTAHGDFVENAIERLAASDQNVFIAVAFFTEFDIIERLAEAGNHIRLIVRLGYPTSPIALKKVLRCESVQARFYTDKSFHSKLYIFGDNEALVGSANLTKAALLVNQEVVVSVTSRDPRFEELALLFSEYWHGGSVLTDAIVKKYSALYARHARIDAEVLSLDESVENDLGRIVFANIERNKERRTRDNIFLESYRKTLQESVAAFNNIRSLYEASGRRKVDPAKIPLRLEIDSFFSFVRERYAKGESWRDTPIGWQEQQRSLVSECMAEWFETPWPHFEETIVEVNYPRLLNVFADRQAVLAASDDDLFSALLTIHSLHERQRFFRGGVDGLRREFFAQNDRETIRESLAYLIFGAGELAERMANLIYQPEYKLHEFGQANVQELVGWCNAADVPVINGRTTKVLRYFGFDIQQLSD